MKTKDIKINALYELDGVVCRVVDIDETGYPTLFVVAHHKRFTTFAHAFELKKITKAQVKEYLAHYK